MDKITPKYIISLDGTVASGKSFIAKQLLEKLELEMTDIKFLILPVGDIYRTIAYYIYNKEPSLYIENKLKNFLKTNNKNLQKIIENGNLYFKFKEDKFISSISDKELTDIELRHKQIAGNNLAEIGQNVNIKLYVHTVIRALIKKYNLILIGREMGHYILKDRINNTIKLYAHAQDEIRVERRYKDEIKKAKLVNRKVKSKQDVKKEIMSRDIKDFNGDNSFRLLTPEEAKNKEDHIYIDNSKSIIDLNLQLDSIIREFKKII